MMKLNAADNFEDACMRVVYTGNLALYTVLTMDAAICIAYLLATRRGQNHTLIILLNGILVYSVGSLVYWSSTKTYPLLGASGCAVDGLIHWVITQ